MELTLSAGEKTVIRDTFVIVKREVSSLDGETAMLRLFQTMSLANDMKKVQDPREEMTLMEALNNHGLLLIKVKINH